MPKEIGYFLFSKIKIQIKNMEIAIIYDINKEYIKAVNAYETLIRNNDTIPDYYINLSFLYWSYMNLQFLIIFQKNW